MLITDMPKPEDIAREDDDFYVNFNYGYLEDFNEYVQLILTAWFVRL